MADGTDNIIVASLETLLCLDATDKLDPFKRVAPPNRELVAQGVGNMFAGFLGGLPVTQVIVRSSTNIQSGGRTKVSAIVHGLIILVCAFAAPGLLNKIPLASLATMPLWLDTNLPNLYCSKPCTTKVEQELYSLYYNNRRYCLCRFIGWYRSWTCRGYLVHSV